MASTSDVPIKSSFEAIGYNFSISGAIVIITHKSSGIQTKFYPGEYYVTKDNIFYTSLTEFNKKVTEITTAVSNWSRSTGNNYSQSFADHSTANSLQSQCHLDLGNELKALTLGIKEITKKLKKL